MARNRNSPALPKVDDDELLITAGGDVLVHFAPARDKFAIGQINVAEGKGQVPIVFWGNTNNLPDEREYLIANNNIVPQIIATKRNIILGAGMMCYRELFEDGQRRIEEVQIPTEFEDFITEQDELHGGVEELCNDLLKHGQYFVEYGRKGNDRPAYLKPQPARIVRAEKQNEQGRIERYWLHGMWNKVNDVQRLEEFKTLESIPAYDPAAEKPQPRFLLQGSDKLLGGPYYYHPHYHGSLEWIKVANCIPTFHLSNLENGFNIRYLIKVPEDYFIRSLSEQKRNDTTNLASHIKGAKQAFKERLNKFLAGAKNAGRGLIVTKHFYKNLQKEWPELEIVPLEVDLKDEAMLKLFETTNTANTSAHGTPPALAGIATGAKMTSGSEIRNLFNFYQITAAPSPRRILLRPYRIAWRDMGLPADLKLGFRNYELQTTDKEPTGHATTIPAENPAE